MSDTGKPTNQTGYAGQEQLWANTSFFNLIFTFFTQFMGAVWTMMPVQVTAVDTDAQTVSVLPLVKQMDGQGQTTSHDPINGIPFWRLQGGISGVITDPAVDDIGICIFAQRDISAVKANKAESQPGSFGRFDPADGVYFGGMLNVDPTQFVRMTAEGIEITSPMKVTITAPTIELDGNVTSTGTFKNNDVPVGSTHAHSGVTSGGGTSGPPTP